MKQTPFKENIFIDADSLIYSDLSYLWDVFRDSTDFSAYGKMLTFDDTENGWFSYESAGKYRQQIQYIPRMNGTMYYIKQGCACSKMYDLCMNIINTYHEYKFKYFSEPADEPVMALAASVLNMKLIDRLDTDMCIYPFCNKIFFAQFRQGGVYVKDNNKRDAVLIHWGTPNTAKPLYEHEVRKLICLYDNRVVSTGVYIKYLFDIILYTLRTLPYRRLFYNLIPRKIKSYIKAKIYEK